ncbi:MAG: S9 family peptidase [Planctomycetota bacterium]
MFLADSPCRRAPCLVAALVIAAALAALLPSCRIFAPGEGEGPVAAEVPRYDVETIYGTRSIFGSSFSADERAILATSDESGVFNCYRLSIEDGRMTALTRSTENAVFGVSWFPSDDRLLYSTDQGGNELNHLYVREPDGTVTDLTPGENLKARFLDWAADDRSFYVLTNERDARFFDLYRYAVTPLGAAAASRDAYPRKMVFRNDEAYAVSGVSLDGRWVALEKVRTNSDDDIFVWDAHNPDRPPRHVTPHEGNVSHGFAAFTPDSRAICYLSNEGSEFTRAWRHDLESGQRSILRQADWDISYLRFSRDGRYRVTGINANARTEVEVLDRATGSAVRFPTLPEGNISGIRFSRSGRHMAFSLSSDTSPGNIHVLDIDTGNHRRLTNSLHPAIDEEHLVASSVIRYESFDGLAIPALLYRPRQASAAHRVPALVWVHGGPGGQCRKGFNEAIQCLTNHGYGVLAINNRGSTGYGKTFFHLDDRRHGEDDLEDCAWAARHLRSLPWVDGERIGIIGGSYGGYLVVAALAFQPQAFDVGIDIFGVTNWLRTLESIPPWWASFREYLIAELGDPATDREHLRAISPLFHAHNIVKPLLVVQGANDPRVLKVESDEIVAAVKKNGVPVDYLVFDDEGHGFRNKKNRITAAQAYLTFLDRHLKRTAAPGPD